VFQVKKGKQEGEIFLVNDPQRTEQKYPKFLFQK